MLNSKFVATALLGCAVTLAGCAEQEDDAASADVSVLDKRTQALTAAQIDYVNGTYTNCSNRTGSWSIAVTGTPTMDNAALSVLKGDTACTLAITDIHTSADGTLTGSSPIALGSSYGTARSFGSPIKFYANAKLSALTYASNFTMTLLFSDDASTATASNTASYAVVSATPSAQSVPAPNYTLDITGVSVTTTSTKAVDSVTGNLAFTAGANTGDYYVLVSGSVGNTYAAINTAYNAGTPIAMSTSIAASSLLANGVDLSSAVVRSVIIAKIANGVTSYEKFAITFNGPP